MKFSVPISSLSSRGLKNLIFSFYNKCELLSKATDGRFYVSKDFCYSIGDGVFKEQILNKIIVQQEKEQEDVQGNAQEATQAEQAEQGEHQGADENKLQLLGIKIENRTDDYDGDLVFTGFNQSGDQEKQQEPQEKQEAVQKTAAQEDTVQEKAVQEKAVQEDAAQEDAVQVADKPNFDPELENTPTVGTETAAKTAENTEFAAETERTYPLSYPLSIRDRAISAFLDYLVNHCNDVKHVYLEDEDTKSEAAKNEKFAMRAWFTQLGWRGKEDNELRSYFYDRLEGNTAFRTKEDHARWAAKWQPRYFDKHPEMKWVLEEQKEQRELEEQETIAESVEEAATSLIVPDEIIPDETADSAEVAEAVSATVGTGESAEVDQEVLQESAQEAQEAVEMPAERPEAVETATEAVAEAEISSEVEAEVATVEESEEESENKNNT